MSIDPGTVPQQPDDAVIVPSDGTQTAAADAGGTALIVRGHAGVPDQHCRTVLPIIF